MVSPDRARVVLIAGCGPSAENLDLKLIREAAEAGVWILAVNQSPYWLPVKHAWFSLDPDERILPLLPILDCEKYMAVPPDYGRPDAKIWYHRNVEIRPDVTYLERVPGTGPMKCRYGMSNDPQKIHTGNSVYGALGLTWHWQSRAVGIVGLDGTRERYAHSRKWNSKHRRPRTAFDHLPKLFRSTVEQWKDRGGKVVIGNEKSNVTCFERRSPDNTLRWLIDEARKGVGRDTAPLAKPTV